MKLFFELAINLLILFMLIRCSRLYHKAYRDYKNLLDRQALAQQVQFYQEQLALMEKSQQNIRSLRHDMKYHLAFLYSCLRKADIPSALHYLDEMEKCIATSENFIHSGNHAADSILNYHLNRATQLGCELSTKIIIPSALNISDFDLNTLLGNLLDNALDALQKVEKRTLDIYIHYEINILYISIYNSFDGVYQKKNGRYISTKKDKETHGYGLRNIQTVLKKYNGISRFTAEEHTFRADVILNV